MAETTARGEAAPAALEVTGLSHSFGARKALDEVAFTIAPGSFTVLLGQNGAGKTTLFNLITRLYSNRSGSIRIFGTDVRRRPSQALAELGVVFQQRTIDLDLSVMQNLLYAAGLQGIARRLAKRRAAAELARFELAERAGDKVRELSGGQLRRVEIARALLHRPKLLLLDEPTVGLDIGSRQAILEHVRRLVRRAAHRRLVGDASDRRGRGRRPGHRAPPGPHPRDRRRRRDLRRGQGPRPARRLHQAHRGARRMSVASLDQLGPTRERGLTFAHYTRAAAVIIGREGLRFVHQRGRFVSALVRPLVWLFIFAAGFRSVLGVSIQPPYETYVLYEVYITPGLCAMILLFAGMQSSLAMVYDREMGSMRVLLVSPLPRWYLLVSKLLAGTLVAVLQVYAFLVVAWFWEVEPP